MPKHVRAHIHTHPHALTRSHARTRTHFELRNAFYLARALLQCHDIAEALVPVLIEWARENADPSVLCSAMDVCAPEELGHSPQQVSLC